jgi:deoxyribonuclease V
VDFQKIHPFTLNRDQMVEMQNKLGSKVQFIEIDIKDLGVVAGVDVTYYQNRAICVIASMDLKTNRIIDIEYSVSDVNSEYKPGLLALRELPIIMETWKKLKIDPDIIMIDGHGFLHPRRCGLATHISFFVDKPTIGIAKKPFIGEFILPGPNEGTFEYIADKGEIIGAVVRTTKGVKPIYVSVGNYITLAQSIDLVLQTTNSKLNKLPIPVFIADQEGRNLRFEHTNN